MARVCAGVLTMRGKSRDTRVAWCPRPEEGSRPTLTKNRRYEAHYDQLNDDRMLQAAAQQAPTTLPMQAYGPEPVVWAPRDQQPPVWAWITWRDAPATRIPCAAAGWNDRVVVVEWEAPGGRRSVVVWRSAVTRRTRGAEGVG